MNVTKKILGKVCAIIVIVALTISDFLFVGTELTSYAIDMVKTNSSNVDFSAYFINSNGEKVEKLEKNTDMDEEYLYIDIAVKNEGYFNGTISLQNNNFNLKQDILSQDIAKISGNEVKLNQINAGSTVTVKLGIEIINNSTITENVLDQKTKVGLKGQYVNSKNVEKNKFVEIKGETNVELAWKSSDNTNAQLKSEVLTNYIYGEGEEQKRIVQILVNSNVTNNNYPVKNTEINVSIPGNVSEVKVHARNLDATNSSSSFDANNYEYNKETNNLKITVKNENKNKISWNKNAKDSFVVTCVFDKEENLLNKNIKVESKINTYDNKTLNATENITISEDIDGIVSYSIKNMEDSIYKGKIQIGQEREYKEVDTINVDYLDVVDEISLRATESKILSENQELQANIIYKESRINKQEFIRLFGEDGFITVKDNNGILVANINKNTETNEDGYFVVSYYDNTKNIEFKTSKPINVGTLNIENTKTILNNGYNKETVKSFTGIKESIEASYNQKVATNITSNIELKNTSSKANLNVSVNKLYAVEKNENIKLTAVLLNNDESKDLFQNPNIEIKLPKQVVGIDAKCKLLYGNGLELSDAKIEDGNTIKISLKGNQTSYNTQALEGTTLIIYANAEVDKLATNSDEEVTLSYTNEVATSIENNGVVKTPVKIVANAGVITTNSIPELNIETIGNEGTKEGVLENATSEKNATINIGAINNEGAPINNVTILGKFPTAGDSNLGAKLTSGINITSNTKNVKVYYSSKENTNSNINDSSNEWKTEGDSSSSKTFLILIDKLNVSERFNANYAINIPANLGYNKEANLGYTLNYTNDLTGENKTAEATAISLTTGTEAQIVSSLKAYVGGEELKDGDEVKAGEIIKYDIQLKNEGKLTAENASIEVTIPENTTLIEVNPKYPGYDENLEEYTYEESYFVEKDDKKLTKNNIKLEPGQNMNLSYMVKVESSLAKNVQAKTTCVVKYKEDEIKTELTNNFVTNNLIAKIVPYDRTPDTELKNEYAYSYILEIKNLSDIAKNNIEVTINKNDLLDIAGITCHINENSNEVDTSKLTFTIDSIPANGTANVKIDTIVNEYKDTLTNAQISASIKNNGSIFRTNMLSEKIEGLKVETKQEIQKSSNREELYPGDSVKYKITINNVGKIDANELDIRDNYSNYLNITSVTVDGKETEYNEVPETDDNNVIYIETSLKAGEESTIEILGNINEEIELYEVHEIVNQLSVYNDGILVGQTDTAKYNLVNKTENEEIDQVEGEENETRPDTNQDEQNDSNSEDNNQNNDENSGIKISGTAWYDKNENGSQDKDEDTLQGIKATLINLKDNTSKTADTDENGEYSFTNVEDGEYIVTFDYDTGKYMITSYQADGVSNSSNSDAENVKLNINGEMVTKASTNTLKLKGTNIENIDIGLIDAKIFDLSLSKTISKVTISNNEGTQNLDYNDETLAKAEIRAKHLSGSTAIVEYKIKVTNNGEIAGYAKSIVDYKPTDLGFNSGLNKEWYQSGNNLYSTALANTLINPGETKELTLVLTKTMTETNTGLTNNIAEIAETYNTLGVANRDSTPGNKDTKEHDTGSANVIISVSTGIAVSYVALTLSIITLIAVAAFVASKKILKENIKF